MKKHNILFFLLFLIAPSVFGIDYTTYLLYPDGTPDSNCYTKQDEQDKDGWWYNVAEPLIKVALPAGTPKANILIVPGGGYGGIAYWNEGDRAAEWFLSQGYAVAVLKYRMPCGNPNIPFEDACQAMTMLRQNAQAYGLYKRGQFGAVGFSAGGHLVGLLATKAQKQAKPDWCVLGYPLVSMEDDITHMESRTNLLGDNPTAEMIKEWSLDQNISIKTSAMFIALAQDDDIVKIANSTRLYRALLPMGIYSELFIMPTGGHGFDCGENISQKEAYRKALLQFISSVDITKDKAQEINILPSKAVAKVTGNRWTVKEKNIIVAGSPENGYKVYFAARTPDEGEELYVSDGESVAHMVADLNQGSEGSDVKWLSRFNDKAVMQALTKLYISDGESMTEIKTDDGKSLVKPMGFTQINENAFIFTAIENEKNALYICDGQQAKRIYDISNEPGFSCVFPGEFHSSDLNSPWCRVGRKVFFKAQTTEYGLETWVTNGTTEGTYMLKDICEGAGGSAPSFFYNLDNKYLVFKAWIPGLNNRMWYSDGTINGTKPFFCEECYNGDNAPNSNLAAFQGKVYTTLHHRDNGKELFALDPTTGEAVFAKDFADGSADGSPNVFGEFDGRLWMEAVSGGVQYLYYTGNGKNFFRCDTWQNCFIENGYCVVNGTFYGYGLPSGSATWGVYRFDETDRNSERTLVHGGVACGMANNGIEAGYSLRNAGGKLVYAVTTGDWANPAINQGVFSYLYCKEDGVAESIEPDFGPREDQDNLLSVPACKHSGKIFRNNQIILYHQGKNYSILGTPIK